jgi:hypothetical protein
MKRLFCSLATFAVFALVAVVVLTMGAAVADNPHGGPAVFAAVIVAASSVFYGFFAALDVYGSQ